MQNFRVFALEIISVNCTLDYREHDLISDLPTDNRKYLEAIGIAVSLKKRNV